MRQGKQRRVEQKLQHRGKTAAKPAIARFSCPAVPHGINEVNPFSAEPAAKIES
jgi:hypothetical protein